MTEIYKRGKNVIMKFHATFKNPKRVEKFKYKGRHFKLFIDKNDSIWDIHECEVLSWKTIEKGGKKINVPDQISENRNTFLFNRIKGNPIKMALFKITTEIDFQ